jgi:hypothetical protein
MTDGQQKLQQLSSINTKISMQKYGFKSAAACSANPDAIKGFLDKVYNLFLAEQKLDKESLQMRISKLKEEVLTKKAKKNDLQSECKSAKQSKDDTNKEIEALELEKIGIKDDGTATESIIPFVIGAFITILLTFYLFVFYSSSGYSAFIEIKPGTFVIFNPTVYADALNQGGGVIALIILFPVIFLGLGFLIHDAIEKIKKTQSFNGKIYHILLIFSLLSITLIADAFVGHRIAAGIHENLFDAGKTVIEWTVSMIWHDMNFYLVLILGFVVYVIWGFLLNFVLSHPYLKPMSEKIKLQISYIDERIDEKRTELRTIMDKINQFESDITNLENEIGELGKNIIGYENGVFPVNVPQLSASVGEFMGGWLQYMQGFYSSGEYGSLSKQSIDIKEDWLQNKINTLNTDSHEKK